MTGAFAAALILAFPDVDGAGGAGTALTDDLAGVLPGCRAVDWRSASPQTLLAELGEAAAGRPIVCAGVGAGGQAAIAYGLYLGAQAVFAWAPGATTLAGHELPSAPAATQGQAVHIVSCPDTLAEDLKILAHVRAAGGNGRMQHAELPFGALSVALRLSGQMRATIESRLDGGPPVRPTELANCWRPRLAHDIEVDLANAYGDVKGVIHIPGWVTNRAPDPIDLARLSVDGVSIGGELTSARTTTRVRSAFSVEEIAPGERAPFRLRFAQPREGASAEIRIALLAANDLWFDELGFPAARLTLGGA